MQPTTLHHSVRQSIAQVFSDLRRAGQIALMPFIPAGYPNLAATAAILPALQAGGASMIEIGFPFSDPIADGPTIQAAFTEALAHGLRVQQILDVVSQARSAGLTLPVVAMVSYSIIFRYGQEKFFADLSTAGFDGVIIPDLPPPEAQAVCTQIRAAGLDTVLLVSPSTPADRRRQIVQLCSGFVYYMSVAGITGERDQLPADLQQNLQELKAFTNTPVCVGFGISNAQHVAQLRGLADGAIVGSALVRQISQVKEQPTDQIAQTVQAYCRGLRGPAL